MALDVHIVSHTHWDREWYHPFERFRQRLVELIDDLIDVPPGEGESFLLDGQTILIDDYLAARPERADQFGRLLRDGRLEAGPWFVLGDELIASGEAIVRNLFAGRRVLRRFSAAAPPVLYCPDSFGHPAALPEIAAGFGFPLTLLWRGYGGPHWPAGDAAIWRAPSGASTFLFHLPRDGYEYGSHLPVDDESARERWARMRAELSSRSTTGVLLVPNGADHHARQTRLGDRLAALERAGADDGVRRSSLRAFAEALVDRARSHPLPVVAGELRDSYGYTWTLQGTFATRAHEKRLNARAERAMLREAEPWAALASITGASRLALIELAWRDLLSAHPHDTLCGCSIDAVATRMEGRLRGVIVQAAALRDESIASLIGYDAVVARDNRDRWKPVVVVRNPAPRARSGVAIVEIEEFLADVPVGPSSATVPPPRAGMPSRKPTIAGLGPLQVLAQQVRYSRIESPQHYPDNDLIAARRVAVWVTEVPAYGVTTHSIDSRGRARGGEPSVVVGPDSMENGLIRVRVGKDGRVELDDLSTDRHIDSLMDFVDERDVGDLYTPAPRAHPFVVQFRGVRREHRGPLRGELVLRYRILGGETQRTSAELSVNLVLDAGAPFLRLNVVGDNRRENHRIRMVFRGDVADGEIWADAAFGPVRREPMVLEEKVVGGELPPATAPLHRYVSLFDARRGMTVFSDGLGEYEARDGAILVTLVRGVGDLSRNDIEERPGHAGWPVATPGAQCLGEFAAELAVMVHGPRAESTIDLIERTADDVLNPIVGTTLRSAIDVVERVEGVELRGEGLAFSALKQSEDGDWLVLRCVNLLDTAATGAWRVPFEIRDAQVARLDETPLEVATWTGREIDISAGPRAVVTLLVR